MLFQLPITLVRISGVDSEKFLQGQLTCDVVNLKANTQTLTAHCDAKGKVQTIFRLYRQDEQTFYALIHNELLESSLKDLNKYAIFSKVTFETLDWQILGWQPENNATRPDFPQNFCFNLADGREFIVCETVQTNHDFADYALWKIADIKAGIPLLSPESQNEFIPQAMNLQDIENAICFTKGCYIGQETIARAKYRGINKRAMYIFHAPNTPYLNGHEIETLVGENWRKTGHILNHAIYRDTLWLEVILTNPEPNQIFKLGTINLTPL
ncbi:hypothetical protein A6A19_05320 [Actinobacillus delphinicola]|uniref:Aminomethyltransferase n=1 Tax=Actinobacillus delphinicola TaxID=51161 RepID=A0A448TTU4_9PAST|nr:folate-binding protein YgfZ [Actinobacillus delphinicola]MDG6897417.1 hypothetical protein [Actinobacillus delphinicola]VEJ09417.1 aminomethyltransferase [Actinobacillus delphinicola]